MDWHRQAETDVLEQILALLASFAGLADRAAMLPLCLQLPGLAILARAEAVARCFVVGLPYGAAASLAVSQTSDRAARLAAEFRALALILRALLARLRHRARLPASECRTRATRPSLPPRNLAGTEGHRIAPPPAPDTS